MARAGAPAEPWSAGDASQFPGSICGDGAHRTCAPAPPFCPPEKNKARRQLGCRRAFVARATGVEPATTGSTVRYSNQLSYAPTPGVPHVGGPGTLAAAERFASLENGGLPSSSARRPWFASANILRNRGGAAAKVARGCCHQPCPSIKKAGRQVAPTAGSHSSLSRVRQASLLRSPSRGGERTACRACR